jgi:hypothetical protein
VASVTAGKLAVQLLRHWGVEENAIAAAIVIKDALASFMSLPDIGSRLGCAITGMIPPAGELCLTAARAGIPLALMEPDSIAAANLTALAEKLGAGTLVAMAY